MKKAVAFVRGNNKEAQTTKCGVYAQTLGYKLVGVEQDETHRLSSYVFNKAVDAIIVTEETRFTRNAQELEALKKTCEKMDIEIIVTE